MGLEWYVCWEMYGRKEGVLKGWEVGENYATMLNVSQSNKGYRVETKKKRGGAGNVRSEILEVSKSPPPPDRLPHAPVLPFIIVYLFRSLERPHAYTDYFRLGSVVPLD